jgi:hypothetical protein
LCKRSSIYMFIAVFLLQKQVSAVEYENLKRIYRCYFKRLIQDRKFNAALCGQCGIHARQAMPVPRNTKGLSRNRCCSRKTVSIIHFTCVSVILVTQHTACTVPSSLACSALQYLPHYLINGTIFGKRYWTWNGCLSCTPNSCPKYFSFYEEFSYTLSYIYIGLYVKHTSFLTYINENSTFSAYFQRNVQIRNFTKIRPVGAELFRADGRTGMMKLIIAFHNFANAPKRRVWLQVMWWDIK